MKLFRKKENTKCCCGTACKVDKAELDKAVSGKAASDNAASDKTTSDKTASDKAGKPAFGIKVLGSGCAKCNALEEAVKAALIELKMDPSIEHVTDFTQIAAYGVMTTPALVVDGKVVSYGKVLKKEEAMELIRRVRN